MGLNLATAEDTFNGNIKIPRDLYTLRCIDGKFRLSPQKQTPIITLTFEVVSPDEVKVGQDTMKVAGLRVNQDFFLTEKAIGRLSAFHRQYGLPLNELPVDNELEMAEYISKTYIGLQIKAILYSEEQVMFKEVVNDDGTVERQAITDSDGKPIVRYSAAIAMFVK